MPGVIKTIINEPDFEITIYEWNDRTIQFLKIIADDKSNNNDKKNKTLDEPYIPDQKENGWEDSNKTQTEIEEKKPDPIPKEKQKVFQNKVKDEEILATDGNMKIYRQVKEYLERHLPDNFTRLDVINMLPTAWRKIFNEELSLGSAKTYWAKYKRYMINQGLIKEDKLYCYHKVEKDETEPKDTEEDDDSDDGKDHCYLPEWTNKELDVLEKYFFKFPTEESILFIAAKLNKTKDEVRLKAKKRGMMLR